MNKKTYICNISGGHGHFLTYVFDKCCTTTKDIDESPFDSTGRSHQSYGASGNFVFIDTPEYFKKIKELQNENIIVISIDDEVLYFERACINRAGQGNVNLFNENEIEKFLRKYKSTFPDYCKEKNITFLCTPWDTPSVDFLEQFNLPAYKIASADLNNLPFLNYISSKGRPIIISTGMSNLEEIKPLVEVDKSIALTK